MLRFCCGLLLSCPPTFDTNQMKTFRIWGLATLVGVFVLSGCTNPNLVSPDRDNVVYAAGVDETMDALENVITRMRWTIDRVDESVQGRIYMNGSTLMTSTPRTAGAPGRRYTVQIAVITEGRNSTRVQLTVDSQDYGSNVPRETRRQFFNYLENEGLVPTAASE